MKKKILALCLGVMLSLSAVAMAAVTPEAEMMSTQQVKANAWIDAMLVKHKPADSLKLMSAEFQKNVNAQQMEKYHQDAVNDLGQLKGFSFLAWARQPGQEIDILSYLMGFEKEKFVRGAFFFDRKGNLVHFELTKLQQTDEKDAKKK